MRPKTIGVFVVGIVAGITLSVLTADPPPEPQVKTKRIYVQGPVRTVDAPTPTYGPECKQLVKRSEEFGAASERLSLVQGEQADLLRQMRAAAAAHDYKAMDKFVAEFDANEAKMFGEAGNDAQTYATYLIDVDLLTRRCNEEVRSGKAPS